jgi:PAS domain S-box-containing protein
VRTVEALSDVASNSIDHSPATPEGASASADYYRLLSENLAERLRLAEVQSRRLEMAERLAGLGHWRLDLISGTVAWSPQMYEVYGLDRHLPLEIDQVRALIHPDDREATNALVSAAMEDGAGWESVLTRIVRQDGEVRYLCGSAIVERDEAGRTAALVGTLVDVTEFQSAIREAEHAREQYKLLSDNANDLVLRCDRQGYVLYASPSAERLTGYRAEELIGRAWCSLIHPEDSEAIRNAVRDQIEQGIARRGGPLEYRFVHRGGHVLFFEGRPTLVYDGAGGAPVGFTTIVRDVTARKTAESELIEARREAEAAAAVKAAFLANMSHELRTPLTSILGFVGLAADQAELSDLTRLYLSRARDAGRALLSSVNDVLDFSKLEAGQVSIDPRPTDVVALVQGTLELFTPQAGGKDLALSFETSVGELHLLLDPDRVRQVLLNLIGNAVKFTAAGSVTVSVRIDDGNARFEIADTGKGIAPEQLRLLFQRFSQVDGALARANGGTGLGLAICKGLVEAMGGEIGVDSTLDEGSRFWFVLPAQAALADQDHSLAGLHIPIEGLRILLADDHLLNRELAKLFLCSVNAEVTEASDGHQAVDLAREWPFDAILMDINMPNLDGPGAVKRIRAESTLNADTPILAFTASTGPDLAGRLRAEGFDGIVAKPVDPRQLLAKLAEVTRLPTPAELDRASGKPDALRA